MASKWDPLTAMPNLTNKIVVVTGGSTGIGFATVRLLARRGAKVYFTTRSELKARQAHESLRREPEVNAEHVNWLVMNLFDLRSVHKAAEELKGKETRVDILINNAAASTSSTKLIAGRYEQHMAANHIGPFFFVNRILPLLKNALKEKDADVRVINISSTAHIAMLPRNFDFRFTSPTCFSDPVPSYPWQWRYFGRFIFGFDMIRYAVSKAAVVLFTKELQRRLDDHGLPILCVAVHPGEVLTEGLLAINNVVIRAIARLTFLTAEKGAATPLFVATASEVRQKADTYKGKFVVPLGKVEAPNPVAEDERQVKGLWENTTLELNKQLVAQKLPSLEEW